MNRRLILISIFILLILEVISATAHSPYYFLRTNGSARSAGLAGCFVSVKDDASAVFFNPATIATVSNKTFSATFLKHILDINSGQLIYVRSVEDFGIVAGSVAYMNYGSFDEADINGKVNGTFGASDLSFAASYANLLDSNLYYGLTAKFIHSNIENASSSAIAVDAGLIYIMPDIKTNIGIAILNAGAQLSKFENESENVPVDIRMGVSHILKGLPMMVNFSFHHLADKTDKFFDKLTNFSLAGELYAGKYIQIRLGYDNNIRRTTTPSNNKQLSGFSGGAGIKHNHFNFDYGVALVGTAATLHRFSIALEL
jgi:hypothetical protein